MADEKSKRARKLTRRFIDEMREAQPKKCKESEAKDAEVEMKEVDKAGEKVTKSQPPDTSLEERVHMFPGMFSRTTVQLRNQEKVIFQSQRRSRSTN